MKKNTLYISLSIFISLIAGLVFFASIKDEPESLLSRYKTTKPEEPSARDRMIRNFRRSEKLKIVLGGQTLATSGKYREKIMNLRWVRYTDTVSTFAYHHRQKNEESTFWADSTALMLAGTFNDHPLISTLLEKHDEFTLTENGFSFAGDYYDAEDYMLAAMLPNPQHPEWPVFIIAGNSTPSVINNFPERGLMFDYQILKNGDRVRMGSFLYEGTNIKIDTASDRNLEKDIYLASRSDHFNIYLNTKSINPSQADSLNQALEKRYEKVVKFLGAEADQKIMIDYYVYSSFEDQALYSNRMEFAAIKHAEHEVHTVREKQFKGDLLARETEIVLRNFLGEPSVPLLETGLYMQFVNNWHGGQWREMAARISRTGKDLELETLLDTAFWQRQSPLWRQPLAGALVSFLINEMGKKAFLDFYQAKNRSLSSPKLAERWQSWLVNLENHYPPEKKFAGQQVPDFLKGFNFSHEGYQIVDGYGSQIAEKSLSELRSMGVNTVALNPFGFKRDAKKPSPIRFSNSISSENDASVVHSLMSAHSLGMTVLMKPHIWIRGSWPGEIEMQTEEEWQQFFDFYEQWIRHYAILSQLYESEIFSIGLEMAKATVSHEQDFIAMVKRLRYLYDGKITYSANWYGEFDKVTFWNHFDFIGVNSYYPLSKDEHCEFSDLVFGAEEAADKIEKVHKKYEKPVLVTEIGFTSTRAPWKQPHEYSRRDETYQKDQYLSYKAIHEAWNDETWMKGIYWWKWPTAPERDGDQHAGFTPRGKPSQQVVKNWFTEQDTFDF